MDLIGKTPSKNEVITNALSGIKVKDSAPKELGVPVSDAIDKALFFLGLNKETIDTNLLKLTVIDDARENFPLLTVDEVSLAIKNGSRGIYGDVKGFAPKDAFNWITAYAKSEERRVKLLELDKQSEVVVKPTDEQIENMKWVNLKNAWIYFKANGFYNDHGNAVYKTLDERGKISFSTERKTDFMKLALTNLEKEYNPLKHVGNAIKMGELKNILSDIQNDTAQTRVKVEAMKIALNTFFLELSEMDMNIEDLF